MKREKKERLRAKAGHAIVEPYVRWQEAKVGDIYIPEIAKYITGRAGKVVDYTPYTHEGNSLVWVSGRRKAIKAYHLNPTYEGMVGKHVIFNSAVRVTWKERDYVIVPLEAILLISDASLDSGSGDSSYAPRCQWCKSAGGEGNILLDSSGFCPKCNLNKKGAARPAADDVKVSDDETYALGGRAWKDDIKRARGIADREQIISYAGQKKRTRNRTA